MNDFERLKFHENKVHSKSEFAYNTYVCTIPLDFVSVPIHWHEDLEMIVIKKGSGLVSLNFKQYKLSAGDILIVLPGELHSIDQSLSDTMEYENILFKKELLAYSSIDLTERNFLTPFFRGDMNIATIISPKLSFYNDFIDLINYLDTICDEKEFAYQLAVKSALLQLIYLLITHPCNHQDEGPSEKSVEKMKQIIMYVSTHFKEPISIEDIANFCHYSSSHFMKFFKQHTGISFISYLNDYRITEAKILLLTTDNSILDISEQCGFTNLSNFNRMFKHKYGISPSKMRK